ncbi:hypothetical protein [Winogradskyella flava]|uniref:hypothetical protein n=1 Tax=Winogradskyella flava TaxID=1884876 RepID=UPI00248FEA75|nr:hypothetical protein [Winogradskyella flava]
MKQSFAVINITRLKFDELHKQPPLKLDSNYLKYLIHYILTKQAFFVERETFLELPIDDISDQYISIGEKAKLARHDKHKKHIDYLFNNNFTVRRSRTTTIQVSVLFRDEYISGKKSFGYRISDRLKGKPILIDFIDDNRLITKIKDSTSIIDPVINSGKYKFLKKYFVFEPRQPNLLKIDLAKAFQLCKNRYETHRSYTKYLNEASQIVEMHNGVFRIYYNKETDGRIHSNITRLPKVYRKFLNYNNKALVEVDLSASILFFISVILSKSIPIDIVKKYSILLMIYKSLETVDNKEIQEFENITLSGSIYNYFIPLFIQKYDIEQLTQLYKRIDDEPYNGEAHQQRKLVKKRLLGMFFAQADNYPVEQSIFGSKFPTLLKGINDFKNENGYKMFSHALFQLEAYLMIDLSALEFKKAFSKKAPIFTLHDCLITTVGHEKELALIMRTVFNQSLGVAPDMTIKVWN